MTDNSPRRRWRFVPETPLKCALYLVLGAALLVGSVYDLSTHTVGKPAFTLAAAVASGLLIAVSAAGLIFPATRGR
ncbi:hypothetical protein [Amycolatopsis pithecellobii]|uniref:Uncharacterized protein n=1 Tax=Amycolatopsis pithecellobii TaxID=664692 RepID=A0A6N7ZC24_9PSEU|nr:hypothetical protein [Amycolatopsis pithecellobii]MTD59303.1 hypothetical protein [Amycolatopsis pithecellobii]